MRTALLSILFAAPAVAGAAGRDGAVHVGGELRQWHKVTLTLDGPRASERDDDPNPFLDYRLTVTFAHESGAPRYEVPGYFAADGDAANTSAGSGTKWRAHVAPDKPGEWTYKIAFVRGKHAAVEADVAGRPVEGLHGRTGRFTIEPTDTGSAARACS